MVTEMEDTKKRILDIALELFSGKGYAAVSVRDICGEVGIKESSIYYHFKNKLEILDSLVAEFYTFSVDMYSALLSGLETVMDFTAETMLAVTKKYYIDYLSNERIEKFIRLILIEQHSNDEMRGIFNELLIEWPVKIFEVCFEILMEQEYFSNAEPKFPAFAYHSMLYLSFTRRLVSGESGSEAFSVLQDELKYFFGINI
jgi:AcrR family transcriptional regulator